MKLLPAELKTPEALDDVFTELAAQRPDTLQIMSDSGIFDLSDRIAALAQMHRLPSFATLPEFVGVGGLLAYGASRRRLFIRSGYYIKRILQGSQPGDLPVEQPTRVELSINVRTAKELDLVVPTTLLAQAENRRNVGYLALSDVPHHACDVHRGQGGLRAFTAGLLRLTQADISLASWQRLNPLPKGRFSTIRCFP
jgi:hypothetical protein